LIAATIPAPVAGGGGFGPRSPAMTTVELQFPVVGPTLPAQHGYDLYAALGQLVPRLHETDCPWQVGPVFGVPAGGGMIHLVPRRSCVRLRLPSDDIPRALLLAGQMLDVAGCRVRLGCRRWRRRSRCWC